ncbi:type II toxin-antitoxin system RelE/ParE family toxin [Mesorhizobium opportunistum]|uniref:type II toxin-antitoxin system RelE/ParE family toxin n=1 Tax=Mesorhizobium opportunistum TaxID=593909 RepID=UPI00333A4ECC
MNESSFANMKELRFDADDGVWRVAFAFDRKRKAILLVAGDQSGVSEKRFYKV